MTTEDLVIQRLDPTHAAAIVDCFERVYGGDYGNEVFDDAERLRARLASGALRSVGAVDDRGGVHAHMAMTVHEGASSVEMGNTVVDAAARGGGLAWQVGAELQDWARELGFEAFLHYPVTTHHIMQRQSVKTGFETGLMLGYLPASASEGESGALRDAATIVFNPLVAANQVAAFSGHLPAAHGALIRGLADQCGILRHWQSGGGDPADSTTGELVIASKRGLARLEIVRVGDDLAGRLDALEVSGAACLQVDLRMDDAALDAGARVALQRGFAFCGWLPGFVGPDVYRLQRVDPAATNLAPALENPVASELLERMVGELGAGSR